MKTIAKVSKRIIYLSTIIWSLTILIISLFMHYGIQVSNHFTYYILLEFAKAICLSYVISIAAAFIVDIDSKKNKK